MVWGPWNPRILQSSPHQGPQVTPHQKPGPPPLLSPLGQWKPALPEQHPDCITGRIQGLPKSLPCLAYSGNSHRGYKTPVPVGSCGLLPPHPQNGPQGLE